MGVIHRLDSGSAPSANRRHLFGDDGAVIGRARTADVRLVTQSVSRRHARVFARGGADFVEDLGSRNGTFVNGRRVLGSAERLTHDDVISLGDVEFRYESTAEEETKLRPDVESENGSVPVGVDAGVADEPFAMDPAGEAPARTFALGEGRAWSGDHRFRRVEMIGRGGMGEVYRAYDRDLDELVAIKRLRVNVGESTMLEDLHRREASIARTIRHPNVVRVLEDGIIENRPFLLLEWVDGPPLDKAIRQKTFDHASRLELLRQSALALDAAHRAGVVHSDLKPANILVVDYEMRAKREIETDILEDALEAPTTDELEEEIARRLATTKVPDLETEVQLGRESEIELLVQFAIEAHDSDAPSWILLCGERGTGKRRIVAGAERALLERGIDVPLTIDGSGDPPPPGTRGLWISLFPAELPDDDAWFETFERANRELAVHEVFAKPLLRGQSIRIVDRICHDAKSARAFVDLHESETNGNLQRLVDTLRRSFELGAWRAVAGGFRFDPARVVRSRADRVRELLEKFEGLEQGVRQLLVECSPIGRGMTFDLLAQISDRPRETVYYLVDEAISAGFMAVSAPGTHQIIDDGLRRALDGRLDPKGRKRVLKRAAPVLAGLTATNADPELRLRLGEVERQLDRPDRAFRHYLEAAREARARYQRDVFVEALDIARALYLESRSKKSLLKQFKQHLCSAYGLEESGITGIDRMRRLPTDVRARLTDFGIARRVPDPDEIVEEEEDHQTWGTPRYMSPEQARRESFGPPSDIYSLGIVARELLEESHPLGTVRGPQAVRWIATEGVAPPPAGKHGEIVGPLIARMLDPDPKLRPTARSVADTIEEHQLRMSIDQYR